MRAMSTRYLLQNTKGCVVRVSLFGAQAGMQKYTSLLCKKCELSLRVKFSLRTCCQKRLKIVEIFALTPNESPAEGYL